jgi:hypothetical protein
VSAPDPNSTAAEPDPQWYKQTGWRFGNQRLNYFASAIYVLLVGTPLVLFVVFPQEFLVWVKSHASHVAVWAVVATMAYPSWAWLEMQAFEPWVRLLPEEQRAIERAFFKVNNDLAKNFWTAVFGIYATAGILLVLKPA